MTGKCWCDCEQRIVDSMMCGGCGDLQEPREMRGLFSQLSDEQAAAAVSYRGLEASGISGQRPLQHKEG